MASDTLNADQEETAETAFEDFNLTGDDVEEALDGEEEPEVETGGETLDDDEAGEGDEAAGDDTAPKVDEGEGAEARTDTGPKGRPRDTKTGKFTPGGTKGAPVADAKPGEKPGAATPKWDKLSVNVDRGLYPIEEAIVTQQGDHHIIAVKSTDYPRFQQRMQRAVVADRMWRSINDAVSEVEETRALAKDAPQAKSDKQIEAETVLDFLAEKMTDEQGQETGQTRLSQIVTPQELKWLGDRVKRMQLEYKETFAKTHGEFITKRQEERAASAESAGEGETQLQGMATALLGMANETSDYPEPVKALFKDVTEGEMKAIYGALVPLRRSIYWKEGKEWFANTQLIYDTAKAKLAELRAKSATPGKPGTPAAKTDPKTARAERLNKGSSQSTSLKTKRAPLRPSDEEHPRSSAADGRKTKTKAQEHEDRYRDTTRKYLNSPGFDLDDDEGGDE